MVAWEAGSGEKENGRAAACPASNGSESGDSWGVQHLPMMLGAMAGLSAALGAYTLFFEPFDVRTERITLQLLRARQGIPSGGLTILHLSDTHFRGADRREHAKIARIRRATAGEKIDLLIHTGDFLHDDRGLENVLALVDSMPKPRLGAFAVTGNHDYLFYSMSRAPQYTWRLFRAQEEGTNTGDRAIHPMNVNDSTLARMRRFLRFGRYLLKNRLDGEPAGKNDIGRLRRALEGRGIQFLDNRAVRLEGTGVYLVGVEDWMEGSPELEKGLENVPPGAPTILLSHNPDIIACKAAARADLILSGHTHGGQIVLPLIGPAYTHTEQLARSEASGYTRRGNTQIYVHRGLGESIPIRFGAPPHVTLIRLLPAREDSFPS